VQSLGLKLTVETPLQQQELVVSPVAYWEGMIAVDGDRNGVKIRGDGYLELTGYSGALVGLSQ
jgi:predicted secreted hydrolase